MRVGSLFTGIGGLDLGFERAGCTLAWMCENNLYARRVLQKHWPAIPIFFDVATLYKVPPVDVLLGGFPCQDISFSGHHAGLDGARSGLWAEYIRMITLLHPRYVVIENVAALRFHFRKADHGTAPLEDVLRDLSTVRYDAEWITLYASDFGFPHARERLFIVAYPMCEGLEGRKQPTVFHSLPARQTIWNPRLSASDTLRAADGIPYNMDRISALGNAVIPQSAQWIAGQILERETQLAMTYRSTQVGLKC